MLKIFFNLLLALSSIAFISACAHISTTTENAAGTSTAADDYHQSKRQPASDGGYGTQYAVGNGIQFDGDRGWQLEKGVCWKKTNDGLSQVADSECGGASFFLDGSTCYKIYHSGYDLFRTSVAKNLCPKSCN